MIAGAIDLYPSGLRPKPPPCLWEPALRGTAHQEFWHSSLKQECSTVGAGVFFCTLPDFLHPQRYKILGGMLCIFFLILEPVFFVCTLPEFLCPKIIQIQGGMLAFFFAFWSRSFCLSVLCLISYIPKCEKYREECAPFCLSFRRDFRRFLMILEGVPTSRPPRDGKKRADDARKVPGTIFHRFFNDFGLSGGPHYRRFGAVSVTSSLFFA